MTVPDESRNAGNVHVGRWNAGNESAEIGKDAKPNAVKERDVTGSESRHIAGNENAVTGSESGHIAGK